MWMFDGSAKPLTQQLKISLASYAVIDAIWIGLIIDRWVHPQHLHGTSISHLLWQGAFFCLAIPTINIWSLYRRTYFPPNEPIHVTPTGQSAILQ
jgi:hypothetical protein